MPTPDLPGLAYDIQRGESNDGAFFIGLNAADTIRAFNASAPAVHDVDNRRFITFPAEQQFVITDDFIRKLILNGTPDDGSNLYDYVVFSAPTITHVGLSGKIQLYINTLWETGVNQLRTVAYGSEHISSCFPDGKVVLKVSYVEADTTYDAGFPITIYSGATSYTFTIPVIALSSLTTIKLITGSLSFSQTFPEGLDYSLYAPGYWPPDTGRTDYILAVKRNSVYSIPAGVYNIKYMYPCPGHEGYFPETLFNCTVSEIPTLSNVYYEVSGVRNSTVLTTDPIDVYATFNQSYNTTGTVTFRAYRPTGTTSFYKGTTVVHNTYVDITADIQKGIPGTQAIVKVTLQPPTGGWTAMNSPILIEASAGTIGVDPTAYSTYTPCVVTKYNITKLEVADIEVPSQPPPYYTLYENGISTDRAFGWKAIFYGFRAYTPKTNCNLYTNNPNNTPNKLEWELFFDGQAVNWGTGTTGSSYGTLTEYNASLMLFTSEATLHYSYFASPTKGLAQARFRLATRNVGNPALDSTSDWVYVDYTVAPKIIFTVSAIKSDGTTVALPVFANPYASAYRLPSNVSGIQWAGSDGTQTSYYAALTEVHISGGYSTGETFVKRVSGTTATSLPAFLAFTNGLLDPNKTYGVHLSLYDSFGDAVSFYVVIIRNSLILAKAFTPYPVLGLGEILPAAQNTFTWDIRSADSSFLEAKHQTAYDITITCNTVSKNYAATSTSNQLTIDQSDFTSGWSGAVDVNIRLKDEMEWGNSSHFSFTVNNIPTITGLSIYDGYSTYSLPNEGSPPVLKSAENLSLSWTYADADSQAQYGYEILTYTSDSDTNPKQYSIISAGSTGQNLSLLPSSPGPNAYSDPQPSSAPVKFAIRVRDGIYGKPIDYSTAITSHVTVHPLPTVKNICIRKSTANTVGNTTYALPTSGVDSYTPLISWDFYSPDKTQTQKTYRIWVADNPAFSTPLWDTGEITSTGSVGNGIIYGGSALERDGTTYYIKIQATDYNWTSTDTIPVTSTFSLNRPVVVSGLTVTGQANPKLSSTSPIRFKFFVNDPEGLALTYSLTVKNPITGDTIWEKSGSAGQGLGNREVDAGNYVGPALSQNVGYNWTVSVDDTFENDPQEAQAAFSINTPPVISAVTLNSVPYTGTTLIVDPTCILGWTYTDAEVQTQTAYRVRLFETSPVVGRRLLNTIEAVSASTSVTLPVLEHGKSYFVTLEMKDDIEWAIATTCSMTANTPPIVSWIKTQSKINPNDVSTATPTFTWSFFDADGQAQDSYQIQVSKDSAFEEPHLWDSGEVFSTAASVVYSGVTLTHIHGVYYVRARVSDGIEWSSFDDTDAIGSFIINNAPGNPTLTAPTAQEYDPTGGSPLGMITVTWTAAVVPDADGDTITYSLQLTPTFSSNKGWKTIAGPLPSSTLQYLLDIRTLPSGTDYAVRVIASDGMATSNPSSGGTSPAFTILNHPPRSPIIVSPTANSVQSTSVRVEWIEANPVDIDSDNVIYTIDITQNSVVDNPEWRTMAVVQAGTTSKTLSLNKMTEGDSYQIRMRATDTHGSSGSYEYSGVFAVSTTSSPLDFERFKGKSYISTTDGRLFTSNETFWQTDENLGAGSLQAFDVFAPNPITTTRTDGLVIGPQNKIILRQS